MCYSKCHKSFVLQNNLKHFSIRPWCHASEFQKTGIKSANGIETGLIGNESNWIQSDGKSSLHE
nr:hypothetical protein [Maribacter algicola]